MPSRSFWRGRWSRGHPRASSSAPLGAVTASRRCCSQGRCTWTFWILCESPCGFLGALLTWTTSYSRRRCKGMGGSWTTQLVTEIKLTWILEWPNSWVDLSKVFRHLLKKHAYLLPAIRSRNMSGCVTCYAGVYVTGLSKSSSTSLPSV